MQKILIYPVLRNKTLPTQHKSRGSCYVVIILFLSFSISKYEEINRVIIWEKIKKLYTTWSIKNP